jgi:hypothetical protein
MKDPAIEEVRQARHEISRECGHDLHKVAAYYRAVEEELRQSGKFQFEEPPRHDVADESPTQDRKVAI